MARADRAQQPAMEVVRQTVLLGIKVVATLGIPMAKQVEP